MCRQGFGETSGEFGQDGFACRGAVEAEDFVGKIKRSLDAPDFLMTQLNMTHVHAVREGHPQQVSVVFYISQFYVETV